MVFIYCLDIILPFELKDFLEKEILIRILSQLHDVVKEYMTFLFILADLCIGNKRRMIKYKTNNELISWVARDMLFQVTLQNSFVDATKMCSNIW